MRKSTFLKLGALTALALGSQAYGQTATYTNLGLGNYGYIESTPVSPTQENVWMGNIFGPLGFWGRTQESAPFAGDGGISLMGNPVRVLLGADDALGNTIGTGKFEVWASGNAYSGTTGYPAFVVNTVDTTSTFKGVNVTVAKTAPTNGNLTVEGTLTVAGKPVVTQAGGSGVALGTAVFTPGIGSFSAGQAKGTGTNSTAFGSATASGSTSFAAGASATASALSSVAIGTNASALGSSSIAIGTSATAHAANSLAFGTSHSWSSGSVAMAGGNAYDYSMAVCQSTTAGNGSFGAGVGATTSAWSSTVLGSYNTSVTGDTTYWVNTDPVLTVGNGTAEGDRSTAVQTLKNGQTTLRNKYWAPGSPTAAVGATGANDGKALVVEGNTELKGKVIISAPQGDINMGIYAP